MKPILRLSSFVLLVAAVAWAADDPKILMQLDRDFAKATAEKGVDGWMQFEAPNAVELQAEPLVGTEQIQAGMAKIFRTPGLKLTWEPTKAEFVGKGGIGYTVGRYELTTAGADGKTHVEHGSYLTTWQKQKDGSWKVVSDIGSPDPQ